MSLPYGVVELLPPHLQAKMNMTQKNLQISTPLGLVSDIKSLKKDITNKLKEVNDNNSLTMEVLMDVEEGNIDEIEADFKRLTSELEELREQYKIKLNKYREVYGINNRGKKYSKKKKKYSKNKKKKKGSKHRKKRSKHRKKRSK
jgi:hypothetical protein